MAEKEEKPPKVNKWDGNAVRNAIDDAIRKVFFGYFTIQLFNFCFHFRFLLKNIIILKKRHSWIPDWRFRQSRSHSLVLLCFGIGCIRSRNRDRFWSFVLFLISFWWAYYRLICGWSKKEYSVLLSTAIQLAKFPTPNGVSLRKSKSIQKIFIHSFFHMIFLRFQIWWHVRFGSSFLARRQTWRC